MFKKVSTIVILVFLLNQIAFAETTSVAGVNNEATKQEVSWPGFVAQSFDHQGSKCYEIIKTQTYTNQKPIPGQFIDDSRYISCAKPQKDLIKSTNRYVTVSGKIIGSVKNDDYEYPVVMTDKVRKWHYNYFNDKGVGTIKPRIDRRRLDFVLNHNGL
ncbi:Slp family lipoprotein [Marinicella rhabdoformis]|uniref:Slp family lipoprotein n=1 Tax=Marinicella rhabdoformis TaxID=2580566 RepID=UPI0012AEB500|nr:Slp family lipoprotein [Marinicella rhabdoformis]